MTTFLDSRKNYLKRHPISGTTDMPAPSTLAAWGNYISTYTITHDFGYIPQIRVYYEPNADGVVWPATGRRLSGAGQGIALGGVICLWEATTTTLTIYLESTTTKTGTRPIYWVLYLDSPT